MQASRGFGAFTRVGLLAAIAFALGSGCAAGPGIVESREARDARDARPNIVLVLVDDLGQQDVSVPMLETASALNARFRTPNLEALAARGIRYSNAYAAAPVCTPSRTAILTGQSPARTHITYWTLEKDRDTSAPHPRLDPPAWEMNGAQPTGAELPAPATAPSTSARRTSVPAGHRAPIRARSDSR